MRKALHLFALFILWAIFIPQARALQSGSPEEALEEIATAEDVATVLKHLPVKVQESIQKLPKQEVAALKDEILIKKRLERHGGTLTRSDDGSWELIEREGGPKATFSIKKTFVAGADALVQIELAEERHGEKHSEIFWILMRFEADEWRLSQVGEWHGADIQAEFLRANGGGDQPSVSPASTLRTLNTALVTYTTTYPDAGYPSSLKALAGEQNQQASPEHAMLVEPLFLKEPAIKEGYEFQYSRMGNSGYQITATPLEFGPGRESFFTDETAVIRFTKESRPATASDPPID